MDTYMTADAKGDQEIRSVTPVAMMNYQRRTLPTTAAAKAVAHQYPLVQTAKKA